MRSAAARVAAMWLLAPGPASAAAGDEAIAARGRAQLGHEFEIRVGETRQLRDRALALTFRRVTDDSRCPQDVVCVVAGRVVLEMVLAAGGRSSAVLIEPTRTAQVGDYEVRVTSVSPPPAKAGLVIPQKQYRAWVVVRHGTQTALDPR